jgi:hypothetical protein
MIIVDTNWITGVSLGFEWVEEERAWVIDLLILRVILYMTDDNS